MEELQDVKVESVLLDRCKCCLGDEDLKNMWEEHWWEGNREIYGEMLTECFGLTLDNIIEITRGTHTEWICESCIVRLRAALEFKKEVLACEQLRFENLRNVADIEIKQEVDECEENGEYLNEDLIEEDDSKPYETLQNPSTEDSEDYQEFEDVEYLELDNDAEMQNLEQNSDDVKSPPQEHDDRDPRTKTPEPEAKPKWSRKSRGVNRVFVYKQYTTDDLHKAIEAVESGQMKTSVASKKYNIPIKTLSSKLFIDKSQSDQKKDKKLSLKFVDEVKKFLTYTNAVPFKTKSARYFCAYCSTDGPFFEEPEDLRVHTRTQHADDRTRNIELMLRPRYLNEVVKVDIDSLHCTVCCTVLPSWTKTFQHLEQSHGVELNECYTRLIPYILDGDLKCAICCEAFTNYHNLDAHMNSHYSTYICQECGDTFLSSSRLAKHVKVHVTGRFPCQECGKVFTLHKYRQKHYDLVHKQIHKNKCLYCEEKFYGTFQRHLHVVEKHNEKVKPVTCEFCGLRFEWRPYYNAHLRRKHQVTKRYIARD